ncbi:MAG: hypothetical protein H7288_02080 [Kineosporiaceae bacterium]|nr:hypothetical protein [Aeromicrobium sp.]
MRNADGANPGIRGWAARKMVAQDARWATDVVLSAQQLPTLSPYVGLLLGHHFVRIAYEGGLTLRSQDPAVGVPELANLLQDKFGPITARVRHATKLLDDTKKTFDAVVDEFDGIVLEHRSHLMGKAVRIARWLETDLGLYVSDRRPVGATVPIAYRLGVRMSADGTIAGDDLRVVSQEWGGTLAVLNAAALNGAEQVSTLDLGQVPEIRGRDRRSDRYLHGRFEPEFSVGLKMLLLAVEGDVNTLTMIVPHTSQGHEESVFRLRIVTLFHALSTLRHIQLRYADLRSTGIRALSQLLDDNAARWLLSSHGKAVRNRCMHYPILDKGLDLDPERPMFGIVEAMSAGRSMADVAEDGSATLRRLAQFLHNWRPDRH